MLGWQRNDQVHFPIVAVPLPAHLAIRPAGIAPLDRCHPDIHTEDKYSCSNLSLFEDLLSETKNGYLGVQEQAPHANPLSSRLLPSNPLPLHKYIQHYE